MNILVIAPHSDDEVLGCGGTIGKRVREGHTVYVCIVTKGSEPLFSNELVEKVRKECRSACNCLGVKEVFFLDYPAVMLEMVPRYELNERIFNIIQKTEPDEVYLPHRGDMQVDHQLVADAAMVGLRPKYARNIKRIFAYETLSETGWNIPNVQNEFIPNVYEDISNDIETKLEAAKHYKSQIGEFPGTRSIGAIEALARYRGTTVGAAAAEAFSLIREIR